MPTESSFGNRDITGVTMTTIENVTAGSVFTSPPQYSVAHRWYVYTNSTVVTKQISFAIYNHSDLSLLANSSAAVASGAAGQRWRSGFFPALAVLLPVHEYVMVVNGESGSGVLTLGYIAGAVNQGHTEALAHGSFPDNPMVATHNDNMYCIYLVCFNFAVNTRTTMHPTSMYRGRTMQYNTIPSGRPVL